MPGYAPPRPLVVLHRGQSRWYSPLLAASLNHHLPLFLYTAEVGSGLEAALGGLGPLGLAGAVIEPPTLQAEAAGLLAHLEPEAAQARRVDLVLPERTGCRGFYQEPLALARLVRRYALGEKALWLGPFRPELALGLRGLGQVSLLCESFAQGEAFLRQLPAPQRGVAVVGGAQAEAAARHADLLIYAGGPLPLFLLQPYHRLLALQAAPAEALRHIGEYLPPEEWHRFYLSALLEPLGHALPPEAFLL
ncbi:hypothetical protein DV704_02885 [Meiothermus sp. QL-1]|uniref:hypothetical protein n=1 Tax=Meiothermus sp. QL-1 TaxID=2058095 RepID=UPI000E0B2D39|nr:hypothetical protein [Meiothermus sp. QL-1]RDI95886.1 hypothetical protein DV704_02885 [Meiothermus sp. QL-1]